MGNAAKRTVRHTPRFKPLDAYDLCPPQVRKALNEALTSWDASACLRHSKKYGWKATVAWIQGGDKIFMEKKNWNRGPCPSVVAKVPPLRANW